MRTILCLFLFVTFLGAEELRINRGILPGGLIDDKKLLSEINFHAKQLREMDGIPKAA